MMALPLAVRHLRGLRRDAVRLSALACLAVATVAVMAGCSGMTVSAEQPGMKSQMRAMARSAPDWMVGRFTGTAEDQPGEILLYVDSAGHLNQQSGRSAVEGQYIGNGRVLWAHGRESMVERRANGFRIVHLGSSGAAVEYVRR